jgi:DNA polymerase III delta prime subunit
MHSYIICSGTDESRQQSVNRLITKLRQDGKAKINFQTKSDPDFLILKPDPSISISAVRELKNNLKLKPLKGKSKIALIISADKLTLPAQHALLKTLEEPAPNTFLLLELNNPHQLLPTIRSRCQIIKAPRSQTINRKIDTKKTQSFINALQKASPGKRISYLETYCTQKADAQNLLKSLLFVLRQKIRQDPSWAPALKLTQEALISLDQNLNLKLTLEHFALNFPKTKSK